MNQKKIWENLTKEGRIGWIKPHEEIEKIEPIFKKNKIERILDLGCGEGRHLTYFAKKNYFVVGSDISSTALLKSQNRMKKDGIKNYCLVENDMIRLPFPNEHFDAVISTNVIHHNQLEKVRKTVNEIYRVLRGGGLVFVTVSSKKDYKFGFGKKLGKDTYSSDKGTIHHFFDKESIRSLFKKFRIIRMEESLRFVERKEIVHQEILHNLKEEKIKVVHWNILAKKLY